MSTLSILSDAELDAVTGGHGRSSETEINRSFNNNLNGNHSPISSGSSTGGAGGSGSFSVGGGGNGGSATSGNVVVY